MPLTETTMDLIDAKNAEIKSLKTREADLEKCLGECIELCDSLVKSIGYECVETTEIKSLVTRAKSLLNPDKTDL